MATKKVLQPYTTFEGYEVRGAEGHDDSIKFGCGDVTVTRKRLTELAELYDKKEVVKLFKLLTGNFNDEDIKTLFLVDINLLELLIKIRKENKKEIDTLMYVLEEVESYIDIYDLLTYDSEVFKRLALTPTYEYEEEED